MGTTNYNIVSLKRYLDMKEQLFSNDRTMEFIKSLTERDAKTFLNLIYAILKDNQNPSEQVISNVVSIYEKQIPRVVKARQKNNHQAYLIR
ncbi:hypothetical protein M3231_03715 [Neobacillus mesonae]|nr:hypothetical protein [Neobacillus mesonae]